MWLAEAVSHTNGFVTTMDIEAERTREAKQHLEHFNLDQRVVLHTCDAALFLKQATPDYDLILLDAERSYYTSYWPDLSRLLQHSNALLVVDNVVSHADQVTDFIACIDDDVYHKIVVPIGAGLLLVSKKN